MNSTIMQSLIWLSAGGILVLFMRRRKSRRTSQNR
jgi:hypothetical protein